VPESPDLTVVADALHVAITGRSVTSMTMPGPLAVRGTPAEAAAMVGQAVTGIRRRGKFLLIDLERDAIAINPMLTGRLQLAAPGAALPSKTAVVWGFGPRRASPPDGAAWTRRAAWLPADADAAEIRYRDQTQMGKVYLRPAGVDRPIPGLGADEQGPDADDPALIGNAYSDEILHAAGLLPFRKRSSLAAEEVDTLYRATRETLAAAVVILQERVPPTFEKQVRDFLAVHDKGGRPCPRCGTRITEVKAGGFITSYCRGCQS
jgi:formamidopyrimidine-DNA glycosylase